MKINVKLRFLTIGFSAVATGAMHREADGGFGQQGVGITAQRGGGRY